MRILLKDIGMVHKKPMVTLYGNQGAIQLVNNTILHQHNKHVEIHIHYLR